MRIVSFIWRQTMGLSAVKSIRMFICLSLVFIALSGLAITRPSTANACGGPETYDILTPMSDNVGLISSNKLSLWYPFTLSPKYRDAMKPQYGVSTRDLDAALENNDIDKATSEAIAIVNAVLDMPSADANNYQEELIRALEFLELKPFIDKLNPKVVSEALTADEIPEQLEALPKPLRDVWDVRVWFGNYEGELPKENVKTPQTSSRKYAPMQVQFKDLSKEERLENNSIEKFLKENPENPRTPTLRFVAMQKKFKREIPDGWVSDIQEKVPAKKWRVFEGLADGWLNDYPEHPLADLVRFWKNRIFYLEGRHDLLWKNLLSIFPRRLPRLLVEMDFIGGLPDELIDSVRDPVLLTALVPSANITPERWSRWWKLSEENMPEPWAANLQERLLYEALDMIKPDSLPEGYPDSPSNPTAACGKLRAMGLIKAGKWDAAGEQISSLKPDNDLTLLKAIYYVRQNDLVEAALVEGLGGYIDPDDGQYIYGWPEAKAYLIRVLIDDNSLKQLQSSDDKTTRDAALYEEGVRLAFTGHWGKAAKLIEVTQPSQAALWRETDKLSRDTSPAGLLKLARFFKRHNGELFYGIDKAWYRTLCYHYIRIANKPGVKFRYESDEGAMRRRAEDPWDLPWSRDYETDAIEKDLTHSEMWLALQTYVKWLETAKSSPEMREVVKEADTCYNWLINIDATNSEFWGLYLKEHPVVVKLREAGRRARGK